MKNIQSISNDLAILFGRRGSAALPWIASAMFLAVPAHAREDSQQESKVVSISTSATAEAAAPGTPNGASVTIEAVELPDNKDHAKEVAWLGLGVEESTEALSSQLGLKPGEGLVVTLVAADSPAFKAEFHKNDVLVELDGQMLVHPLQLRKLVQMHAQGETVQVTFYRGGKKQTIPVKLGKTSLADSAEPADPFSLGGLKNFQFQLKDGQLNGFGGFDKSKMNMEIKRTMDQTRKAIQDAMQHGSSGQSSLSNIDRQLEALAHEGVDVDKDTTVVIRDNHNSSKTLVQTDESGSYVLESGEKTRLTARDKDGKLLFEGAIDTAAEREKVPKEVWEKVAPMVEQITAPAGNKPKTEGKAKTKTEFLKQSSLHRVIQVC